MRKFIVASIVALLGLFITLGRAESKLPVDVERALSADTAISEQAIAELRGEGRPALDRLLQLRDDLARSAPSPAHDGESPAADQSSPPSSWLARLDAVIDRVGGQRYCTASRLFWHTDLVAARREAEMTGKPILSLRMLGKLTDEYSCANSRFFRTTLYANEEVSSFLRGHFILHWQSVRPVPVVTIDFGDGRLLRRTLTGNSVHYLLTADGRPVDALPGLYGPQAFLSWLQEAKEVASQCAALNDDRRAAVIADYHQRRLETIAHNWSSDLNQLRIASEPNESLPTDASHDPQVSVAAPTAENASKLAQPKRFVEAPLLTHVALTNSAGAASLSQLEESTNDDAWRQIAALHAGEAELDDASRRLIRSENPTAAQAGRLTFSKIAVEDPLIRMVAEFQSSIAMDTVKNEYLLHRRIHQWFADGDAPADIDLLNDRVYAELFLTPGSDPWLGLVTPGVYSALENDGVVIDEAG